MREFPQNLPVLYQFSLIIVQFGFDNRLITCVLLHCSIGHYLGGRYRPLFGDFFVDLSRTIRTIWFSTINDKFNNFEEHSKLKVLQDILKNRLLLEYIKQAPVSVYIPMDIEYGPVAFSIKKILFFIVH